MITDDKFTDYIGKISDQYEELKDLIVKHVDGINDIMSLQGKLAEFRDTCCIALRESHTTKNPDLN